MKTDIQIAQESTMLPIKDVAANYGITENNLGLYEKNKEKRRNHKGFHVCFQLIRRIFSQIKCSFSHLLNNLSIVP